MTRPILALLALTLAVGVLMGVLDHAVGPRETAQPEAQEVSQ